MEDTPIEFSGPDCADPRTCPSCGEWAHQCKCEYIERLSKIGVNDFARQAIKRAIEGAFILVSRNYRKDRKQIMERYDDICEYYHKILSLRNPTPDVSGQASERRPPGPCPAENGGVVLRTKSKRQTWCFASAVA